MSLGNLINNLYESDKEIIYKILFEQNTNIMKDIIFRNDISKSGIVDFLIYKLESGDKSMLSFFKDVLRNGYQKKGLEKFINTVLKDKKNLVGIELGSFCGNSSEMFIDSGAFDKLYCIDAFDGIYGKYTEQIFNERFKDNEKIIKIKNYTNNAVNNFTYASIDFIYIDADHNYNSVKQDILNYFPKIKNGGIVAGHDYCEAWTGVIQAVNETFGKPIEVFEDSSWYVIK